MLAEELEYSSYNEQKSKPKQSKTKKTPMKKSGVGGWLLENVGKTTYEKDDDSDGGLIDERDPNDIYQLDENNESVEVESVSEKDNGDIMDKFIRTTKKIAHFAIPVPKSDKEKIFSLSERTEIEKILGEWEEPERYKKGSVSYVLKFRNYMRNDMYPDLSFILNSVERHFHSKSLGIQRNVELHGRWESALYTIWASLHAQ
jgi:hypothetical protein